MTRKHAVTFVTIVPSPYQQDFFAAIAARGDIDLRVLYMEAASPDSPWPEATLRPFERLLPGFWVPFSNVRFHFNWSIPDFDDFDFVVLSSMTSWTGQWLMRRRLRGMRWLFWGEILRKRDGWIRKRAQRLLAASLATAAGIVGVGRAAEQDYAERFPGIPHFSIPYHCNLSEFLSLPRRRESEQRTVFLFCGQMIRRKGVDLLLIAFDRLVARGLDVELRLVGREADLGQFLLNLSSRSKARIHYDGFQPPEKLPDFFADSDAFVLPSRHDGWGVVVNQALGAGLPVITSDAVGAGLDLVEDEINGLKFAAGDLDGLERSMARIASSPEEARRWGEASRRKALELTPEAGAEKWVRVFESLADGR
jgi:glycosyltransferase involved in cell wall biosynthesis